MTSEQQDNNTLDMISDIRGQEPEAPEQTQEQGQTQEQTQQAPEEIEREAESRRDALLREIAIDPYLAHQYEQGQPAQEEGQPQDEEWILPFDPEDYDPTNIAHQQALINIQLAQQAAPLFEMVKKINDRFEQAEQVQQVTQMQQVENQVNQKAVAFLDTYVPGFQGIADKIVKGETLTPIEKAVFSEAANAESAYLQHYPQARFDPRLRAQIAQQIGPGLKEYAKALGLVAQPRTQLTDAQKQTMMQESYVESSNAVPAANAGDFAKAQASGDALQMIRAIRQSR